MAIKNYTTKIPALQTIGEIQGILAAHGARKIMIDYSDDGSAQTISFALMVGQNMVGFRIGAKPQGVLRVMENSRQSCSAEQAECIAWRNVKDWIAAQIALVETEQAAMEEVFLPYLVDQTEKTLYETIAERKFYLPPVEETV